VNLQHVNAKIFVDGPLAVDLARVIEVFHRWVSQQVMDELLIDVADYRHVPRGPGVVLVGHEADYAMDGGGGRYGLLYNRKAPLEGSNEDRFGQALGAAAHACRLLEAELSGLKFARQQFELLVNDRALAPNTPETFEACKGELESLLSGRLGQQQFRLEHNADPRRRFAVTVQLGQPLDLAALAPA
jgi:hypothetical protein